MNNTYTPNNRPPYMWIPVENDLPYNLLRVFAVWTDGTHKLLARSYCFDGIWKCLEHIELNDYDDWHVSHWQYAPKLPE